MHFQKPYGGFLETSVVSHTKTAISPSFLYDDIMGLQLRSPRPVMSSYKNVAEIEVRLRETITFVGALIYSLPLQTHYSQLRTMSNVHFTETTVASQLPFHPVQ